MYSEFIVDYYCQKLSLITRLIFKFWTNFMSKMGDMVTEFLSFNPVSYCRTLIQSTLQYRSLRQ